MTTIDATSGETRTDLTADCALDAWLSITRPLEAASTHLESALGRHHGICLSAYEVMNHLAARHGWTPMSDVCQAIARSQPRISRLVAQMQEEGLVERARLDGDGRAYRLLLTRKGRRVYRAASDTLIELLGQVSREDTPVGRHLGAKIAHSVAAPKVGTAKRKGDI